MSVPDKHHKGQRESIRQIMTKTDAIYAWIHLAESLFPLLVNCQYILSKKTGLQFWYLKLVTSQKMLNQHWFKNQCQISTNHRQELRLGLTSKFSELIFTCWSQVITYHNKNTTHHAECLRISSFWILTTKFYLVSLKSSQ